MVILTHNNIQQSKALHLKGDSNRSTETKEKIYA